MGKKKLMVDPPTIFEWVNIEVVFFMIKIFMIKIFIDMLYKIQ